MATSTIDWRYAMVTYTELFAFCLVVIAVIELSSRVRK